MESAGLNLREVENVVYESQQGVAGTAYGVGIFMLFGRERGIKQETRHADNRVHWGANFMAHCGQEVRFKLSGLQGLIPRLRKFDVLACQLAGGLCERILRSLSAGDIFADRQESGHRAGTVTERGNAHQDGQVLPVFSAVGPFPLIHSAMKGLFEQSRGVLNGALVQVA